MSHHTHSPKILVVEDDKKLSKFTSSYLSRFGYHVTTESSGDGALERVLKEQPDLVLLDIMLPGIDGFTVCRRIRRQGFHNPVLMLSARAALADELAGFEAGADDYLRKPIQPEALLARVRVSLQRSSKNKQQTSPKGSRRLGPGEAPHGTGAVSASPLPKEDRRNVLRCGRLTINRGQRKVAFGGKRIALTTAQFDLLWLLALHRGQALSRKQIFSALYGKEYNGTKRVLDIHVSKLRKKLRQAADSTEIIKSIHGVGYMMVKRP